MANSWYVSSVAYAAIPQFAASHAYTLGDIVRPLTAPGVGKLCAFRCTTGGTSSTEPTWPQANNGTVTTGGATFTNVTGQSAYGWGAAAGDMPTVCNDVTTTGFAAGGDTVFLSSDHAESASGNRIYFANLGTTWAGASTFFISVNRGGSVPPVAADITSGASLTVTSGYQLFDPSTPVYVQGITFILSNSLMYFGNTFSRPTYFKNCALQVLGVGDYISMNASSKATLDNTTVQFGSTGGGFGVSLSCDLTWINTPSAVQGATLPLILFKTPAEMWTLTARGVDLSAIVGTLVGSVVSTGAGWRALFDSCKIASGVTRYQSATTPIGEDLVEFVNCFDGTNTLNEKYGSGGGVTTERTITLSGGAADDIGGFSHKFVSNASGLDKWAFPLEGFWFDVENTLVGSSRTATVEIISSASLNNDDISLLLEYQGTSSSPVASFAWSLPATPLTANAAITTSTATWNSSPSTPQKQKLQITFTPQVAGRVRGLVRLGKPSTTVYVNPQVSVA